MIQIAIGTVAGLIALYLLGRALNLDLGYSFLSGAGGFNISTQWLTSYDSNGSRQDAYLAGIVNTVRLVLIGIVMVTVIGVLAGIARLSNNWLVSRLATLYVEVIRNTPLLIQIVFWYTVVLLQLPKIADAIVFLDLFYLSNRALALPFLDVKGAFGIWLAILVLSAIAMFYARRVLRRREARIGGSMHTTAWPFALFLTVGIITFFLTGAPLEADVPSLTVSSVGIRSIGGGLQVTPEFAALLLGLVIYTGAFVAEIVRGSIQALPTGQSEAAAALGLSSYQRMTLIILPQALRVIIPPLTNQYLNLTKNSSLAVAIAYPEIIWVGTTIINNIGHAVPVFILIFATYLVLSLVISAVMNSFNKRVQLAGR